VQQLLPLKIGFVSCGAIAQLLPDTSLGSENSVLTPQSLRTPIEGGVANSSFLFYSFLEFNVGKG